MTPWGLIRSGAGAPAWNMAVDEALLEGAESLQIPILRLYSWSEPAATFGYFQKFQEVAHWTHLRPLVRRPTGGGLVPHDADWTYTLVFPPEHPWYSLKAEQSYRQAHDWVAESFRELKVATELAACCAKELPGRCFIGAEKFDVLANGKKIAGAAQKRNKAGLLIQGSIQPPRNQWRRQKWEEAFFQTGRTKFGCEWSDLQLSPELLDRAHRLNEEKYGQASYNERR